MDDRRPSLTAERFEERLAELSAALDSAHAEHYRRAKASGVAETEHEKAKARYKLKKAAAFLAAEGTVPEKDATAELACAEDLEAVAEAAGKRVEEKELCESALAAIFSRRAKISALQSLMAAYKEEGAFERTGPK